MYLVKIEKSDDFDLLPIENYVDVSACFNQATVVGYKAEMYKAEEDKIDALLGLLGNENQNPA